MSPLQLGGQLLLMLGALVVSYSLSQAEMALLSANRIRVRQRAKSGDPAARRARRLLQRREQLLVFFLIGQSASNVLLAAIATGLLDRWLGRGWLAPVVATAGITLIVVVGAEIVPKVLGKRDAERFIMSRSRLLELLDHLWLPVTGLIHIYIRGLLRLVGRERRPYVTREELKLLVRAADDHEETHRREKRMLASILDFRDTVAREVMIPLNRVIALPQGASCDQWRALVRRHGYTRMPLYAERPDRIVGLLNIFDLLYDPQPSALVDGYLRAAPIVPESKRVDHLLVELQKARNPMAIVVDEFGQCRGVVTVEDIVEEVVGEMEDEHEADRPKIRRLAPRTAIIDALIDIDDLNAELELGIPKGRYDTAAGLILKRAGRVPRVGESFALHGVTFEVLEADAYAVRLLKISLPPVDPAPGGPAATR